jgi:hypothetical protein
MRRKSRIRDLRHSIYAEIGQARLPDGIHVFRLCKIKDVDGTGMEALIA